MLPPDFLGEPIWQRLTWTLLHFLWQGLAVAVVVSTLLYVWRLQHSRSRYLVYLSAMVMMAACPLVTFIVIEVPELATVASREVARGTPGSGRVETDVVNSASSTGLLVPAVSEGQRPLDGSERVAMAPLRFDVEETTGLAVPVASKAKLSQYVAAIQPYGLVVWIAGVLLLAARLALSWLHVRWLTRGCQKVGAELAAQAVMLGKRLGLQAPPCVCVSDKIQEAIVVGIWRPLVLLPSAWIMEMLPEVLEAVIAHELAHVRRFDLWVNLLQRFLEMLLFYHPAIWWLSRRVSLEREMCADDLAVVATKERLVYATTLEQLGRMQLGRATPQFGAGIGGNKVALLRRVGNILGMSVPSKRARWWPAGLLALAG